MIKRIVLFLSILFPSLAAAQGAGFQSVLLGPTGRPLAGAQVTVCASTATGLPCAPPSSIFADPALSQPISNPIITDSLGNWGFWATPGNYQYSVTGNGVTPAGVPTCVAGKACPYLINIPCVVNVSCLTTPTTANIVINSPGSLTVNGTTTTTGAGTHSGTETFANINNTLYATTASYLQSNVASVAANSLILVTTNQNLTSSVTMAANNVTIKCLNGATITYSANATLGMNGDDESMYDCTLVGPGTGVSTSAPIWSNGNRFQFLRNKVSGFGSTGGNGIILASSGGGGTGGNNGLIADNKIFGNADLDIFVNNQTASSTMSGWRLQRNYAGEIIVHTTAANSQINNVIVDGNSLFNGQNSKIEFCVEVGQFGGQFVNNLTSTGNTCTAQANGTNGGYSFSGVNNVSESGDVWNANGFTFTVASLEHVGIHNATITGTISNNGTGGDGLTCDRCTNSTFSANTIVGWKTGANDYGIHNVVSSTVSPNSIDNTFTGNVLIYPAGGAGKAIWEQCNATGAKCQNNTYVGNHVLSDGTAGSICLVLENDTGTFNGTVIASNNLIGCAQGINVGTGVTAPITYLEGLNTAATPFTDTPGVVTFPVIRGTSILTGAWNCTNVTPVTVNANVTTDQNLMACTIPAGVLNRIGRSLNIAIAGIYSTPAASTSQMTLKIKLCTVSGCGSGTVITPINIQSTALGTVQITNNNFSFEGNSTTQTAGASSAYEAHGQFLIDLSTLTTAADSVFGDTNTATVGTIDSTAQLFLQVTFAFSAASASNTATQRQLIVQTVN